MSVVLCIEAKLKDRHVVGADQRLDCAARKRAVRRASLIWAFSGSRTRAISNSGTAFRGKLETLADRLRRAEGQAARKQAEASSRKAEVLVSVGETVLGMFLGRRSTRAASSAMSKYRQSRSADLVALAWAPHWSVAYKDASGFPRNRMVPAW